MATSGEIFGRERGATTGRCHVIEAAMSRDPNERPTAVALGEQLQRLGLAHGFAVDEMALQAESGPQNRPVPAGRRGRGQSADAVRGEVGNLPLELTSFVGRRTQVSEVNNVLASCTDRER
jgi:hypothetical protein